MFYIKKSATCYTTDSASVVFFLKLYRESSVDIDARLGVVPTAAAAIGEAASFCTTVIRILGIEDIIDLTHEADSGVSAIGYWRLAIGYWQ